MFTLYYIIVLIDTLGADNKYYENKIKKLHVYIILYFVLIDTLGADNKTIIVNNSGRINGAKGKLNDIDGTVVRPDAINGPGELIVNFPQTPQSSKPNCKLVYKILMNIFFFLSKFHQNFTSINTVEPPISGHSKRRTPLIRGQNISPRPFPFQSL